MNKEALGFVDPSFEDLNSNEAFGVNGGAISLKVTLIYSAIKAVSTKATVTLATKKISVAASLSAVGGASKAVSNHVTNRFLK
ncbi:hypothetical protein [Amphibacillus indicireducens]|uniref:Type 2 lantibiotic n=1 Tax=Amphibacillus indicireducens TaxID=1076330 RepID=A0ABP7V926_9BACI